jgi:hypothetical protein
MSSNMYPRAVKICLMQDTLKMHKTSKMPEHSEQESLLLLDPLFNKFEMMLEESVSLIKIAMAFYSKSSTVLLTATAPSALGVLKLN